MPDLTEYDFTARGSGYYRVFVNGVQVSQHIAEREAAQRCIKEITEQPDATVTYDHDYEVDVVPRISVPGISTSPPAAAPGWQLGVGHYEETIPFTAVAFASQTPTDTQAHVIFPRPDSETNSRARHLYAHPNFDYVIPILIRGGAFPYHMVIDAETDSELTGAGDPIRVGANHDSSESYLVTIPAATVAALTAGAKNVVVRVTDQVSKDLRVEWSVTKNTTNFLIADNSYTGGDDDGTWDKPISNTATFSSLLDAGSANSANKILVFKLGNSLTTPYTKNSGWQWSNSAYPSSYIGVPGASLPVLDCSGRPLTAWGGTDGFIGGFKCTNGKNNPNTDTIGYYGGSASSTDITRNVMWNMTLDCTGATIDDGDTNASVWNNNSSTFERTHIAFFDIRLSGLVDGEDGQGNTGGLTQLSCERYTLYDKITYSDWGTTVAPAMLIKSKRKASDFTLRRFTAIDNVDTNDRAFAIGAETGGVSGVNFNNTEILRNNINISTSIDGVTCLTNSASCSAADGPHYINFNTFIVGGGTANRHSDSSGGVIYLHNNVSDTQAFFRTYADGPTSFGLPLSTVDASNNDDIVLTNFNADGTLTQAYLDAQGIDRGTFGHEIA